MTRCVVKGLKRSGQGWSMIRSAAIGRTHDTMLNRLSSTLRAGLFAAAAALAIAAPAQAQNAAEQMWPLQAGNRWVLREPNSGATQEIRVDARRGDLAYVAGMLGQDNWFGFSSAAPNSLYVWNADIGAWHPFARFGYISTKWRFDLSSGGCDLFENGWARGSGSGQAGTTAIVPAGSFANTREMQMKMIPAANVRCRVPVSKIYFAKGIGPVKVVMATGESYDLETAVVGGKSYPSASPSSGIEASLAAPKPVWGNKPNTIRCITTPCPSNEVTAVVPFTFNVKNNTSAPITFQFASGQQFDIEIADATGKVLTAWSDNRMFTMALTSRTLRPGETMSYAGEVALKGRDGVQFNGVYTATASLKIPNWATPQYSVSAKHQVHVQIVP